MSREHPESWLRRTGSFSGPASGRGTYQNLPTLSTAGFEDPGSAVMAGYIVTSSGRKGKRSAMAGHRVTSSGQKRKWLSQCRRGCLRLGCGCVERPSRYQRCEFGSPEFVEQLGVSVYL